MSLRSEDVQAAEFGHPFPQLDIRTAAGHVGRNGDLAGLTGLSDDIRLFLMVLCIQYVVFDARTGQVSAQQLRFFDGNGPHEDRPPGFMKFLDFGNHRRKFFFFGLVDDIRMIFTDHRHVGRNDQDLQLVNFPELLRLGVGRAGHPRQFGVHPEIILEGDRCQGLIFLFDLDMFLRLEGLMEAVAVPSPGHDPSGEFIHDDDLPFLHEIVDIAFEEGMRP